MEYGMRREGYKLSVYTPRNSGGLSFWRPWRTEKKRGPSPNFEIPKKSIFTLKFYNNNITNTGTELQRLSKKYRNLQ